MNAWRMEGGWGWGEHDPFQRVCRKKATRKIPEEGYKTKNWLKLSKPQISQPQPMSCQMVIYSGLGLWKYVIFLRSYMAIYMYVFMCIYVHVYVYVYMYTCIYEYIIYVCVYVNIFACIWIYIYVYIYINIYYICMYHICVCIYIYIYIAIHF